MLYMNYPELMEMVANNWLTEDEAEYIAEEIVKGESK